ncbi:transmembrane protein 25 isoform X4 [Puntigrus tetrazona]|uniref:transmembrane protein 25 isoform X4 n=1 Tax=Puntigrus tetrazona TaxID=1606681 RepID=UPI001C8ADBC6|nr:transmembrane protein 25 isoform X4 [Puntigrus tetrazona]
MPRVCLRQRTHLSALFFHTLSWACSASIDPAPKIDGQRTSSVTVQENVTQHFSCQSEGWDAQAPPLLTWYLNGERQSEVTGRRGAGRLVMTSPQDSGTLKYGSERNSTFTLKPKRWDRELVCAAQNPVRGESYNASVTLNVQFQPEILRVDAHYSQSSDPGLALILFALVRSNPPASIRWVDQSGQLLANSSDFLILDSRSFPWLTNHSLQLTLSSLSGNITVSANNSLGSAHSNLTLTEFLQSRVEVPVFGIVTGGVAGFITLLIFTLMVFFLLQKDKTKEEPALHLSCKRSENGVYLPRENMSLPSHVQLNDDGSLCKAELQTQLSGEETSRGRRGGPVCGLRCPRVRSLSDGWLHLQGQQHQQRRDLALIDL